MADGNADARYRSLFENSFDAILLTRPDGAILSANPAACRMLGMTEEEITRAGREGVVVRDERLGLAVQEREKSGKVRAELTFRRKDGTTFVGEVTSSIFIDADGRTKTSMIIRDTTERWKAEEALERSKDELERKVLDRTKELRESEAEYKDLADSITDLFFAMDPELRYTYWNKASEKFTGVKAENAIGKTLYEVFGKNDQTTRAAEVYLDVMRTGIPQSLINDFVIDARNMSVEIHVYPRKKGVSVLSKDVSRRKEIEEALMENEARYHGLFDNLPQPVSLRKFIYNEKGEVIDTELIEANPAALEDLGVNSIEELRGRRDSDYLGPEQMALSLENRNALRVSGRPITENIHFDPNNRDYLMTSAPIGKDFIISSRIDITETKQAQRNLQTTMERFYRILSNMPYGILLVTNDNRVEFANQAYCEIFNLKDCPENLSNLPANEMIEKIRLRYENPDAAVARISEIVSLGQPVKGEEIEMADNRTFLRDFIPISLGEYYTSRLWIHVDISNRRQWERLSEALNKVNSLINSTLDYNEIMQQVLNEGAEAIGAESSLINMHEGDHWVARFVHNFPESILGQLKTEEESPTSVLVARERRAIAISDAYNDPRVNRPSFKVYGARSVLVAPIFLEDEVTGIIAFYQHSSSIEFNEAQIDFANNLSSSLSLALENSRLFESTRKSEAKYHGLFDNMQEEVHFWKIVHDDQGNILTWRLVDANPPTLRTWGRELDEIVGLTTDEIFGPGSTGHYMAIVQKVMKENAPYSYEDYFPNLNKYFSFTTIPFGEYFITTGVDISDIRIAQRGLEEHARKLERSNAELQQFAYVASHDLQEPLRMVTAYLGLLKKKYGDQLDGKAKDYMDIAIDGGLRARGLIQDLLEFSRVGSQAKVFRPTNMEKVLAKALENLMIRIGENNALITHDHLPTIMADDSQMTQVMQNLIGNAIKFHGTEPPMVHISCKDEGTEWCFSVSDNGIGIDPQYRDKIFVLFQRLHARNEYEGTGIGLAICKKIIELHGGKIWFDSRPGSGTTFYFTVSKGTGK